MYLTTSLREGLADLCLKERIQTSSDCNEVCTFGVQVLRSNAYWRLWTSVGRILSKVCMLCFATHHITLIRFWICQTHKHEL